MARKISNKRGGSRGDPWLSLLKEAVTDQQRKRVEEGQLRREWTAEKVRA